MRLTSAPTTSNNVDVSEHVEKGLGELGRPGQEGRVRGLVVECELECVSVEQQEDQYRSQVHL